MISNSLLTKEAACLGLSEGTAVGLPIGGAEIVPRLAVEIGETVAEEETLVLKEKRTEEAISNSAAEHDIQQGRTLLARGFSFDNRGVADSMFCFLAACHASNFFGTTPGRENSLRPFFYFQVCVYES